MKGTLVGSSWLAALLLLFACSAREQAPTLSAAAALGGTSWQLVKFQSSDEKTLMPDDKAKYTIQFNTDGSLSARIDCNRGRGTWKSSAPSQLQLGSLALTARCARRARCTIASSRIGVSFDRTSSGTVTSFCR